MAEEGAKYLFGATRYAVLVLSMLMLTFTMSNSLIYNFTVICMDDIEDSWLQSPTMINALFSATAIGCLVGTLPISHFIPRFGIRNTVFAYGIVSTIATLVFPFSVEVGYPLVFFMRILQCIPTALPYVVMGQLSSRWAPENSFGLFMCTMSCCMQFSSVFTMPVSGGLCTTSFGWRSVYYLHGVISLITVVGFFLFYHDRPEQHRMMSTTELKKINKGKAETGNKDHAVPYKAVLTDVCILGTWVSMFGSNMGYQAFLMYGPTYLNKVLGLDVRATGWGTALPFLISAAVKFTMGPLSDHCTILSKRHRLIFFTILSQGLLALSLVVMSLTSSQTIAQIAYTGSIVASGIIAVGTFRGAAMVARHHVHFIMAVSTFLMVTVGFSLPYIVSYVCPDNVPEEWQRLFLWMAVVVVLASSPYCFLARDQPAKWAESKTLPDKICPFDEGMKKNVTPETNSTA